MADAKPADARRRPVGTADAEPADAEPGAGARSATDGTELLP
jgi:hypothetical protein